jgi:beta-glucosidase
MLVTQLEQAPASKLVFPTGFVWGTATSSYQIEGGINEGGRSPSIWDTFSATPGKVVNGDTGAVACDHYHLWREDIALLKKLGVQSYRFSVAWPRVLPGGRGWVNERGLDFYDRLVDGLLEAGITPCATLYHWDLPQVLQDAGGWVNRQTAYAFVEYTEAVVRRLGDRVGSWITHNEPWCASFLSYDIGEHAPGLHNGALATKAAHHLLLSHGLAVPIIRQFAPRAEVGITLNLSPVYPARPGNAEDNAAAFQHDGEFNRLFLDPVFRGSYPADFGGLKVLEEVVQPDDLTTIAQPLDFLGINYYSRAVVEATPQGIRHIKPPGQYTDMDWEIYPTGLYDLLKRLQADYPTKYYITENGAAAPDVVNNAGQVVDEMRVAYLDKHLGQVNRAIEDGVNVAGYYLWSFMDNFEWAYGYTKRFGIVYVDFESQKRIIKKSGHWYSQVIAANGFVSGE